MSRSVSPSPDVVQPPRSWEVVYATAVRILPDLLLLLGVAACDLDDVFQDVVLAAYVRFEHFDPARWRGARPPKPAAPSGEADVLEPRTVAEPSGWMPDASSDTDRPRDPAALLTAARRTAEGAWLYGIAWRKVRHYLERAYRRREVPVGLLDAPCLERIEPVLGADLRIAAEERRVLAIALLSSVPPERRIVLVLKDAFELPMPEIAEALDLNENTAYNRLRLARLNYRAAVKRLRPEQRQALESSLLLFAMFPEVLLRAVIEPTDGPRSGIAPEPAARENGTTDWPERLRRGIGALRWRLGWLVAGGVAVVPLLLAPAPSVAWARRFDPVLPRWEAAQGARPGNPEPEPSVAAAPAPQGAAAAMDAVERGVAAPRPGPAKPMRAPVEKEQRWIDAAQEALFRGDLPAALEQLAEHARRFPQGRLRSTRERLRAQAMSTLAGAAGGAPDGGGR
jgi:DNA-directed RNA polymerase specialized sigma24 family protein